MELMQTNKYYVLFLNCVISIDNYTTENTFYSIISFSLLINVVILLLKCIVTPQPLRAVGVLFSPMVSGWAGGQREKGCPGCISETERYRKLILGRDIG